MKHIVTITACAIAAAGIGAVAYHHYLPVTSGVPVGGTLISFHPEHVSGADKNTMECPICKYTTNPAVQVWVNSDSEKNVAAIAEDLDRQIAANRGKALKAFVVYANLAHQPDDVLRRSVADIAARNRIKEVALAVIGSSDRMSAVEYEINPDTRVKNTVFVYKNARVSAKFVNLSADSAGLAALNSAVNRIL